MIVARAARLRRRLASVPETRLRWILLALWVASSLLVAHFHEPWRDEAQAWLVARSSGTLGDLLYRAALEATGPLYYLLLWGWARTFPLAFPGIIFWVSWSGTLLAVSLLLFYSRVPLWISALAAFGYLFGYEYAVIARLYGWGSFLLLAGIAADQEGRDRLRTLCLSLACLVQLNFVFATAAWCAFRILGENDRRERIRRALGYAPIAAAVALSLAHLHMASGEIGLGEWDFRLGAGRLGSTLITPFIQSRGKMGWPGIVLFPMVLLPLRRHARLALLAGMAPFLALFLFHYYGMALSRHGGPLFLAWLMMCVAGPGTGRWARRSLALLLSFSMLTGIEARVRELAASYSDGLALADRIGEIAREKGRRPKVFVGEDLTGFVVAARLGTPLWTGMEFVRIDYPAFTKERNRRIALERFCHPWEGYTERCSRDEVCFYVGRPRYDCIPTDLEGRFAPVFAPTKTISDESLFAFEIKLSSPAP